MTDVPPSRIVVDVERVFERRGLSGKRCDFILFFQASGNLLVIAPVELKSGDADTSEAAEQLQAGATFADDLVSKDYATIFRPILVHGHGMHPKERRDLNRAKIRFRGADLSIKTARCDQPRNLARALSPYATG